jgi:hypothetical protein
MVLELPGGKMTVVPPDTNFSIGDVSCVMFLCTILQPPL